MPALERAGVSQHEKYKDLYNYVAVFISFVSG